jgi:hypothetical protein
MLVAMRRALIVVGMAALLATAGCGGSAAKKDARRLQGKCGVVQGNPISAEQARCIAQLWGLEGSNSCPIEVEPIEGYPETVYRAHECGGVGLLLSGSSGRVLAVLSGDEVVYPR